MSATPAKPNELVRPFEVTKLTDWPSVGGIPEKLLRKIRKKAYGFFQVAVRIESDDLETLYNWVTTYQKAVADTPPFDEGDTNMLLLIEVPAESAAHALDLVTFRLRRWAKAYVQTGEQFTRVTMDVREVEPVVDEANAVVPMRLGLFGR